MTPLHYFPRRKLSPYTDACGEKGGKQNGKGFVQTPQKDEFRTSELISVRKKKIFQEKKKENARKKEKRKRERNI